MEQEQNLVITDEYVWLEYDLEKNTNYRGDTSF